MEYHYFFVNDCIQNISSLFSIHQLLSISIASKQFQYFIFELKQTDNIRVYYKDISRFQQIKSLTISAFIVYTNLSSLINLKHIVFYNEEMKSHVTKLSNLTSCKFKYDEKHSYFFHTNMKQLYDLKDDINSRFATIPCI